MQEVKVIIGLNEKRDYYNLLQVVRAAYKQFFPEFKLVIGLISKSKSLKNAILKYADEVVSYPPIEGIPTGNLAKIIRYYIASWQGDTICIMNDIDIIPLCREYFIKRYQRRKKETLLTIGKEWYGNGKFPTPWCTGEGFLFQKFINPYKLSWKKFIRWTMAAKRIDGKENITRPFKAFSDESLIRALLKNNPVKVTNEKKYQFSKVPIYSVSRHHKVDTSRLFLGKYIEGHHLIPIHKYKHRLDLICKYLACEMKGIEQ